MEVSFEALGCATKINFLFLFWVVTIHGRCFRVIYHFHFRSKMLVCLSSPFCSVDKFRVMHIINRLLFLPCINASCLYAVNLIRGNCHRGTERSLIYLYIYIYIYIFFFFGRQSWVCFNHGSRPGPDQCSLPLVFMRNCLSIHGNPWVVNFCKPLYRRKRPLVKSLGTKLNATSLQIDYISIWRTGTDICYLSGYKFKSVQIRQRIFFQPIHMKWNNIA